MSTGLFADEVLDFMDEVAGAASTHTPADGWDMPAFENTPPGRRARRGRSERRSESTSLWPSSCHSASSRSCVISRGTRARRPCRS